MRRRDVLALFSGAVALRPLAAPGQRKTMPVIGLLNPLSSGPALDPLLASFRRGLGETGYVEGQNVRIEYRWADGHDDRLPALAADLVERKVDVIAATGGLLAALAAKKATATIPIVFGVASDPITVGLVASLAHPAGNLTGASFLNVELHPRRLELLSELVPQARVIALLVNPNSPAAERIERDVQEAARAKGMQLHILKAASESEIDAAFASYVELHAGALVVSNDPLTFRRIGQLTALSLRYAVPTIASWREFADSGGLMSYGASLRDVVRQQGIYTGKILNGANPADLPVIRPTKFELVVNLNTAKALGLTVPQSLLARADEVIE